MILSKKIDDVIRDVKDFPKQGIVFKDITPVLANPELCSDISDYLSTHLPEKTTKIIGIESRGFLFGFQMAIKSKTPFILIRKKGKLPYKKISLEYELEYGSCEIEIHKDSVIPGDKVVIHDDLLATGGTAAAAAKMVRSMGADIIGFSFLVELGFLNGRNVLEEYCSKIVSIVKY